MDKPIDFNPSASAFYSLIRSGVNTKAAIAFTSSMSGENLPLSCMAFSTQTKYCDALGPAPQLTYWLTSLMALEADGRVLDTRETAYSKTLSAMGYF